MKIAKNGAAGARRSENLSVIFQPIVRGSTASLSPFLTRYRESRKRVDHDCDRGDTWSFSNHLPLSLVQAAEYMQLFEGRASKPSCGCGVGEVLFRGLERPSEPQVYLSYKQLPDQTAIFYSPRELVIS